MGVMYFRPPPFDDFLMYTYICRDFVYFVWRLAETPFFKYPGYPTNAQCAKVAVEKYSQVVSEFGELISASGTT